MKHVDAWVFDLDHTLYDPSAGLFDLIGARMVDFISARLGVSAVEAERLRDGYWDSHGTTMNGLVDCHGVDADEFLAHAHDIDLASLAPAPALAASIAALPGRRVIHTNGPRAHGERVIAARGLEGAFDAVFGIEDAGYRAKPNRSAFETIWQRAGIDPRSAAMIEDDPRNLTVPKALGMVTVLVGETPGEADYHTQDLAAFLAGIGQR